MDQQQIARSIPDASAQTPAVEDYDLVIIGSGEGSKYLAWTLSKQGLRVVVVERQYIGGSCPNIACLPSKNIIHSAGTAALFRHSEYLGVPELKPTIDMTGVRDRKRDMVTSLVALHIDNFKKSGAELVLGNGQFIGARTVEVALNDGTVRILRGVNVVIGTGTRATIAPLPGLAESKPLTHIEALDLGEVPDHLIVLGAGYVGLELAQAMRRFGSDVTVISRNAKLLHNEDDDVAESLRLALEAEGVHFEMSTDVKSVSGQSGEFVRLLVSREGVECSLRGSHLLVAVGRSPNTDELGLDLAGVETTQSGFVKVNEYLETTATGVWAVGDVAGSPQFTHIAFDDFRIVRDNLAGKRRLTTGRQVPFCLFTSPEFARIGLSETEARSSSIAYRVFKIPMSANLRARTLSETQGFLKALVAADSDQIIGFTAVGVNAGEIMGAVQIAMIAGLPYTALRDAILTHPTLLEGLIPLFSTVPTLRAA
ncbi:dihydrolipoyl dehydrogenase family protein [Granulicella arctica]|uniref:dihydrolipoyl dehydrogenase family protein n=1 Tax=Granulicella arctica TaxID=940613 RepID=UPI0021E00CE2|nr:FAD-dependent oxidoreductase [Granulicella arctica]